MPVGRVYCTDMISNPPRPIEANKWIYQEIYGGNISFVSKGHLGYNLVDTYYNDTLKS